MILVLLAQRRIDHVQPVPDASMLHDIKATPQIDAILISTSAQPLKWSDIRSSSAYKAVKLY